MTSGSVHEAARKGFGAESGKYERGRPEYPTELLGWLSGPLGLGPGSEALDLGAGTGKFTRLLARTGAELIAVEPVAAMRERLLRSLPAVRVLPGTAEMLPLADASVDAVICAQAFHWFANRDALAEMHRVLRPGGRLGMVWNVRDESVDWVAAISTLLAPHEGDAPRFHTGRWRQPFADQRWFSEPQQTVLPHQHVGGFDEVVVDRFLSVSFIAALPDRDRAAFEAALRALPNRFSALRSETIVFPYLTEAWFAQRLGQPA